MKMNETVANMLNHPIATAWIIGSVISGVVRIIYAAKGKKVEPSTVITIGNNSEPKEE